MQLHSLTPPMAAANYYQVSAVINLSQIIGQKQQFSG